MSFPAAASMAAASSPFRKSSVLAMRALRSSKLFSSLANCGGFDAGEPGRGVLGPIRGDLHLADQRIHVREQPVVEQRRRIDLLLLHIGRRFVENTRETGQHLGENGYRSLIERERHGRTSQWKRKEQRQRDRVRPLPIQGDLRNPRPADVPTPSTGLTAVFRTETRVQPTSFRSPLHVSKAGPRCARSRPELNV